MLVAVQVNVCGTHSSERRPIGESWQISARAEMAGKDSMASRKKGGGWATRCTMG